MHDDEDIGTFFGSLGITSPKKEDKKETQLVPVQPVKEVQQVVQPVEQPVEQPAKQSPEPIQTTTPEPVQSDDIDFEAFMDAQPTNSLGVDTTQFVKEVATAESPAQVERAVEQHPEAAKVALPDSPLKEEAKQINDGDSRTDEVKNEAAEDFFNDFVDSKELKNSDNPHERRVGQFFDKYKKVIESAHPYEAALIQKKIDNKITSHRAGDRARDKWQEGILRYEDMDNSRGQNNLVFDEAEKVLDNPTLFISRSKGLDLRDPAKRQFFRDKYGDKFVHDQDRNRLLKNIRSENLSLAKDVMDGAVFKPTTATTDTQRGLFNQLKRGEGKYNKRGEIAKKGAHLDEIGGFLQSRKLGKNYGKVTKKGQRAMDAIPKIKTNVALDAAIRKAKDFDFEGWWTKDSLTLLQEINEYISATGTKKLSTTQKDELKSQIVEQVLPQVATTIQTDDIPPEAAAHINNYDTPYICQADNTLLFIEPTKDVPPSQELMVVGSRAVVPQYTVAALPVASIQPLQAACDVIFDVIDDNSGKVHKKWPRMPKFPKLPKIKPLKQHTFRDSGFPTQSGTKDTKQTHHTGGTTGDTHIPGSPSGSHTSFSGIQTGSLDINTNNPSKASRNDTTPLTSKTVQPVTSTKGNVYKKQAGKLMGWGSVTRSKVGSTGHAAKINTTQGKAPKMGTSGSSGGAGAKLKKVDNNITRKSVVQKILSAAHSWQVDDAGYRDSGDKYLPYRFFVKDDKVEVSILGTGGKRKSIESCTEQEIQQMASLF